MTTSRRDFLKNAGAGSALLTAGSVAAMGAAFTSCSSSGSDKGKYTPLRPESEIYIPDLPDKAMDGKPIKAALIGCGGRGTGAAINFLDAGDNLSIVALADMFPDRIENCRNLLKKEKGIEIPDDACFLGFDAYQKVCELPVDLVLIASPNCFHPEHTKYAVDQGKHVFVEKPSAIDPVGYRTFLVALKQAKSKGLNVMNGAQYHWDRPFVESYKMIQAGYIGKILNGNVFYNTGKEQVISRQPEWTDTEYMLRSFFNWNWINGDQISNMLIHWVDIFVWFSHLKPIKVSAFGSRIHQTVGNAYDNFSMDFEFEDNVHLYGMVRRIDGCDNARGAIIQGDKGVWRTDANEWTIHDLEGNLVWHYDEKAAKEKFKNHEMYALEHIDLVNHIRQDKLLNVAETNAISAMACIMARESAYSGKVCTWENMVVSDLNMVPTEFASGQLGKMDLKKYEIIPLPGVPPKDTKKSNDDPAYKYRN